MGRKFSCKTKRMKFFQEQRQLDGRLLCYYCEEELLVHTENLNDKRRATIDHIVPQMYKHLKSASDSTNWRVACGKCNSHARNIVQSRIANLFQLDRPQYAHIRRELELKTIKHIGCAFVEVIEMGFWSYNTSHKKLRLNYEY